MKQNIYKEVGNILVKIGEVENNKIKKWSYDGVVEMVIGRCMKCKKEVEMVNPQQVQMKNGLTAAQGLCPYCGTKVFRILKKG